VISTLLYLRLKRHGFNGIIAYWGGNVKGFAKNNRPVFAGSKKAFSKTAHDAPIKRKSHLTNGGKLWYNSFSNRARRLLSEQVLVVKNNHHSCRKLGGYFFL